MNTVGAAGSSAGAHTYMCLYTHIMLYYTYTVYMYIYIYIYIYCACISVINAFVRTKTEHFNYVTPFVTLHKTSCMYIYFWKWVVSNHGGSTEATRGSDRVSHVFSGLISMLALIFCKFLLRAPTCIPQLSVTQPKVDVFLFWLYQTYCLL
jgi:hypothetical protein